MGCGAVHPPHHFHHPLVSPLHRPHYSLSNHHQTLDLDLLTINQMNLSRPLVSPSLVPPSPLIPTQSGRVLSGRSRSRSRARAPINLGIDLDLGQRSSSFPSVQLRSKRHTPNMMVMILLLINVIVVVVRTVSYRISRTSISRISRIPYIPYTSYVTHSVLPSPPGLAPNLVHH